MSESSPLCDGSCPPPPPRALSCGVFLLLMGVVCCASQRSPCVQGKTAGLCAVSQVLGPVPARRLQREGSRTALRSTLRGQCSCSRGVCRCPCPYARASLQKFHVRVMPCENSGSRRSFRQSFGSTCWTPSQRRARSTVFSFQVKSCAKAKVLQRNTFHFTFLFLTCYKSKSRPSKQQPRCCLGSGHSSS
jgi:hypothetical protein